MPKTVYTAVAFVRNSPRWHSIWDVMHHIKHVITRLVLLAVYQGLHRPLHCITNLITPWHNIATVF